MILDPEALSDMIQDRPEEAVVVIEGEIKKVGAVLYHLKEIISILGEEDAAPAFPRLSLQFTSAQAMLTLLAVGLRKRIKNKD